MKTWLATLALSSSLVTTLARAQSSEPLGTRVPEDVPPAKTDASEEGTVPPPKTDASPAVVAPTPKTDNRTASLQAMLDDGAKQQHTERIAMGLAAIGVGSVFVGLGTGLLVDGLSKSSKIGSESGAGLVMLVGGAMSYVGAPFIFAVPGDIEVLSEDAKPLSAAGDVGEMERRLHKRANRARTWRIIEGVSCMVVAAAITPIGVVSAITTPGLSEESRFSAGGAIGIADTIIITLGLQLLISQSSPERLEHQWMAATGRAMTFRVTPSVTPNSAGLSGMFVF